MIRVITAVTLLLSLVACGNESQTSNHGSSMHDNRDVKELSLEDLAELNGDEMPDISYYQDGSERIESIDGVFAEFPVNNEDDALLAIKGVANLLGIQDVEADLKFNTLTSNSASCFYRFNQYYQGIRVLGTEITIISNKETDITRRLLSSYQNYNLDIIPTISNNKAKQIVVDEYKVDVPEEPELVIYDVSAGVIEPTLAWIINTDSDEPETVYLDAYSGRVIYAVMPIID